MIGFRHDTVVTFMSLQRRALQRSGSGYMG